MNSPSSPVAGAKSLNEELEAEISKLVEQETAKRPLEVKPDAERIRSSVARRTATSIEGLEGLVSELQQLQEFLKCEVDRVQGDINNALAGIKIIMETIAPWKSPATPLTLPTSGRAYRSGPTSNTPLGSSTYGKTAL